MAKKILANLKNKNQIILFNETSSDFQDILSLFNFDLTKFKIIDFSKNLNSNLNEDEIYKLTISDEDKISFFTNIQINNDSVDLNKATQEEYADINLIYLVDDTKRNIYLKKIFPTQHIGAKKLLGFGDLGPTFKKENNKISLSSKVNVIFDIENKTFYFDKFSVIKLIFPEIIKYYREATKEEAKTFFSNTFFDYKDSILDNSTTKLKKRLKIVIDKEINFADGTLITKYEKYAKKYKHNLKKVDGKFVIKTKPHLENFLKVFEEVFYQTPISKEDREVDNFREIIIGENQND